MIELRQISKRFGSAVAVDGISLHVRAGEFLTLLGPSGCGKTTLLRLIAGFETPDTGSVWLDGADVTAAPPYRRNVNQVFQSYALFPHLSVRENIGFGLRMQGCAAPERERRVREAVALVEMEGYEDRRPDQLSGGQRQRVALARALAPQPRVLLLDEPLSALDAKLRQGMRLELKRLQRRLRLTFVFVTHDQDEALVLSDRIALVNRGRIEQLGTAADLYHRPATPFAAEFVGETNLLRATVVARDPAVARVRLADGLELTVPAAAVPAGVGAVLLSIRPEKICVSKQPLATANVFPARIAEEIFQGATDLLRLETGRGLVLRALVANESAMLEALHEGDRVWCGLHGDDIVVVPGE